ncbi:hypothetical protein G6514_004455 [Epicoccum nigrum]|nr:hypothetical protein G6514_004455 [Epicoccum nigrum]
MLNAAEMDDLFPKVASSPEMNDTETLGDQTGALKPAEETSTSTPATTAVSSTASADIVPESELDNLCSMLELFYLQDLEISPPATDSEWPLENTKSDQNEPALNQATKDVPGEEGEPTSVADASINDSPIDTPIEDTSNDYNLGSLFDDERVENEHATLGVDAPADEAPKHEDGASSQYNSDSLFDEENVSGEPTRFDAAPESAVTPATPPDQDIDDKAVTDEDTSSDYGFDWLFDDKPGENGESTAAVDALTADTPTEADMAISPPAEKGATAGDEALTMQPPIQEVSSDNTQKAHTTPEKTPEHTTVESTLVGKTPVEEASNKDTSIAENATDEAPISRAPMKSAAPVQFLRIEYAPVQKAPVQEAPKQNAVMEDSVTKDAPTEDVSVEKASAKDDCKESASTAKAPTSRAPINLRIGYAPLPNAPGQNTPAQDAVIKDEVLEDAPAENASAEHDSEMEYNPEHAPIVYAPNKDVVIEDAPIGDAPINDARKKDTIMPDALTTEELDPADVFKALALQTHAISTPCKSFIKPETIQRPTVSPLSSPGSSPPLHKLLQQSPSPPAFPTTALPRNRKADKAGYIAGPPAKRQKMSPTITITTAPAPRLKRRQKQGVVTRRVATRNVTKSAAITTIPAAPKPAAPSPAAKQPPTSLSSPPFPPPGKEKAIQCRK